ncbi:MAG: dioxygenase family protein [Anaerolineales bacterium]
MNQISRRAFLQMCLPLVLAACGAPSVTPAPSSTAAQPQAAEPASVSPPTSTTAPSPTTAPAAVAQTLAPTPQCGDDDDPTPAQTEGPYYTPNTPERTSFLEAGINGTTLVVTGYVLSTDCQPVAQALIDFWHANDAGEYDNAGYKLRGHQFTDAQGRYTLETIVPGIYTGRTRHIHVKVQAPNQPVLTTQLYFPNEPDNARDGIYMKETEMVVQDEDDGKAATFNFVLAIG